MAFITVLSIVAFRYISQAEANSPSKSSCFPVPAQNDMCESINISCPLGSVIYKPNLDASSDECPTSGYFFQNKASTCVGRPVDLITDVNDCYWKQSCLIQFPVTPIYTQTCVNEAQSIIVHDWICIKAEQTSVYFKELICKSQFIGTNANSGVILSHQNIPWNYDRTMFEDKPGKTCETTITVPTSGESRVLVEISLFDIDMQNDQLTINEIKVDKKDFRKEFPPYTQVNIKFSSKTDNSKGGKGFVICFRRLNKQKSNDKSACDGMFEFGKDPKLTFDEDTKLEQGTTAPTEDSTIVHTTAQVKCKVGKNRIDKFCRNCVKGKIKCGKRDSCYPCCPGKTISTKCRNRKGRNRKRKDKKKKKTKKTKKKKDKNGS